MSAAFERTWRFLMRADIEGGARISDDPNDPGGLTKFGISQRAHPDEDIRRLSETQAREIFRREYWEPCRCEELPPTLAIAVADCAFNQGPRTAIQLLQRALRVKVDGVIGPETLAAAAQADDVERLNAFLSQRLLRYAEGPLGFRRGWFTRVLRLKDALYGAWP